jgi:superfamily II DNA or RNA helicase
MFRAVRRACSPAVWSRGIELARAGAVDVGDATDDEAVFHVSTRGGMICPTVSLYPDDLEWDCDCEGRESVCEHVAAAVIVWHRAGSEGGAPRPPRPVGGRIGYRFRRVAGGLGLDRVVVVGETEQRLDATIVAVSERRVEGPRVMARQEDLAVELALGTHRHGLLPPQLVSKVLVRLADCDDVRLDGRPVKVDAEPLLPVVRVRDRDAGFVLELVPGAPLTERFANGIVLCENTLRVPGDPRLTAREREDLERGWHFPADDAAELVTAVLPSLKRRLPLEIETQRLPGTVDARPRAVLDVAGSGETLSVLPTLVYGDPPLARIDGGRLLHLQGPVPMRDPARERTELRRLARLGLAVGVRSEFTGVEAVTFTRRLETWDGEIRGRARDRFRLAAPLEPEVATDAGAFDVTFRSVVELPRGEGGTTRAARTADPEAVLRAWQAGETLVPLLGGGWAPLPADWLDRYGARLADLLAARDEAGAIPRCCLPDLARLCEELDRPPPVDLGALRTLAEGFERIPATSPPADLVTELRPYQREGIDWLALVRDAGLGAMLADDMGLGKTLQALCVLRPRTLVVSPTSVLHNWAAEIRTHRPGLSFCLFHGSDRELDPNADVTLTTYALLRLDADRLASERWETVVLDEAQYIKNPESQVAQAAFRLDARFRLTLTGTPVENRLDELWSQFHFINRGLLGGRRHFQETYVSPILAGDEQAADRLRRRIRPFILRRLKKDVARDLPPRTEMLLRCELSEPEREIYDTVRAATLSEVVRQLEGGGGVMAALEALLRLRQAACHGSLVPECTVERSAKLELLLEALDTVVADGHKALVFSQWTSLLDLAEPHVRAASLGYVRLDGTTRDRAEVVRRFQEDPDVSLMLISLKAGGTGLNLTAADHIFLLDPWWNPAVEDQAADRAHRIGQDRPVMVYRLVALDTVEERILELQRHKRDLADLALEGTGRATGLTRDDLLHLLG